MISNSEIKELIQKIAGTYGKANVKLFDGNVVSVDLQSFTCVVDSIDSSLNGITVRFMLEQSDGDMSVPQVDSTVTVAMTDFTDPYIVSATWLDQKDFIVGDTEIKMVDGNILIEQGEVKITLSSGKISIKNGSKDFKTLMDSFFQHIQAMTFTNGAGVTGTPNNLSDLTNDQSNFDDLWQ